MNRTHAGRDERFERTSVCTSKKRETPAPPRTRTRTLTRTSLWRVGALIATAVLLLRLSSAAASPPSKPNIIFILTDDQGYGDLERHGHPLLKTPHLNRLHDEGVRFDSFYVSPSCSPTRAALMTGMHEFRNGVTHTREPREHLHLGATLLPQLLSTAGYANGFIGKWHLSGKPGYAPGERGFDWCATNPQGPRKHFDPEIIRNGKRTQRKGYREDIFFDEGMTFIDEQKDKPFFLYLATYSPHDPLDAPEQFVAPFRKHVDEKRAKYLGMVANLDYNVGRLLKFLEERKLEENTVVIFMNDNGQTWGLDVYNAGMRGNKCTIWEGGSRAMSLWRWPGTWKPHRVDNLTAHLDVLPTLCELAGVDIPADLRAKLEGFSLLPLLESEKAVNWHKDRFLFHHVARWPSGLAQSHKYAMCGVRQGHYLLLRSRPCNDPNCTTAVMGNQCHALRGVEKGATRQIYTDNNAQLHWGVSPANRWVLFDVKKDPLCQEDLSKKQPERASIMAAAYDDWWDDVYPDMVARGGESALTSKSKYGAAHEARMKAEKKPAVSSSVSARRITMFKRMDANGDEKVTKAEYVGLFSSTFDGKDANGDGVLSESEFGHPAFKSMDADRDGRATRPEFEKLYSDQFDGRDKNRDERLTIHEM